MYKWQCVFHAASSAVLKLKWTCMKLISWILFTVSQLWHFFTVWINTLCRIFLFTCIQSHMHFIKGKVNKDLQAVSYWSACLLAATLCRSTIPRHACMLPVLALNIDNMISFRMCLLINIAERHDIDWQLSVPVEFCYGNTNSQTTTVTIFLFTVGCVTKKALRIMAPL